MVSRPSVRSSTILLALLGQGGFVSSQLQQYRCSGFYRPWSDAAKNATATFSSTRSSPPNPFLEPASAFAIPHGSAYQQNVQDLSGPISKRVEIFNLGKDKKPEYESTWRKAEIKHEREEVAAAAKAKITGERRTQTRGAIPTWQLNFLASLNNLPISSLYDRSNMMFWSSTISDVVTVDRSSKTRLREVNKWRRQDWVDNINARDYFGGAYSLLDKNGRYYVPAKLKLSTFSLANTSNPFSCIVEGPSMSFEGLRREMSDLFGTVMSPTDGFRGLGMLYDGTLAFGTAEGWVGVARLSSLSNCFVTARVLKLNPPTTGASTEVSNSVAVDKYGGIYVVTASTLNRVQWDPIAQTLTPSWSTAYPTSATTFPGRLGAGSGTTPAVFGDSGPSTLGAGQLFVAIADGAQACKVTVFDALTGAIVAAKAATFGLPEATLSNFNATTENSLTVFNNRIFIERNVYPVYPAPYNFSFWPVVKGDYSFGLEQMEFDKAAGTLTTTWTRPDLSWPSAIPTLSSVDGILYGIGRRRVTFQEMVLQTGSEFKARVLGAEFRAQTLRSFGLMRAYGPLIANFFQQTGTTTGGIQAPVTYTNQPFSRAGDTIEVFTLDALNWLDGTTNFSVATGAGLRANPFFSGVTIGPDREIIYGGYFGWNRINLP